jgi:hypothetical protein
VTVESLKPVQFERLLGKIETRLLARSAFD